MRLILGLLVGAILGLVVGAYFGGPLIQQMSTPAAPQLTKGEKMLQEQIPRTAAALEANFPDDYKQLAEDIDTKVHAKATDDQLGVDIAAAIAGLRDQYADGLAGADPQARARWLRAGLALYRQVIGTDGYPLCWQYFTQGPKALATSTYAKTYQAVIDRADGAYFEAAAGGLKTPHKADPVTDADRAAILKAMTDNGISDTQRAALQSFALGDTSDPNLCYAAAAVIDAQLSVSGPAGERVRAVAPTVFMKAP